ncbi:hypothetical protein [Paenibacillus sp. UNC496MF]|uniref:hypothetical protein n=1 Tax=Paenibacillus sp. UNC496MF TaxID=1502753 RepID=UPI000B80E8A9|nr:hypothetical protein [Paenibacillus sp. UNC496MF]
MEISDLSNSELIASYGRVIKELKDRKIIRSKNVVGDLGEYLAVDFYNKTSGLPRLQFAPPGTKNIDAISINGERYSIKASTSTTTSVFYGLNQPGIEEPDQQKFEYVILVLFDEDLNLQRINEITWIQFLEHKRWHSRMSAWNLSVNRNLLENTRTIYIRQ